MSAIDDLTPVPDQPEISDGNQTFHQKAYALYKWMREKLVPAIIYLRDLIVNSVTNAFTGTSSTSLTIVDTGVISFTTQANLSLVAGTPVRLAFVSDPTQFMDGITRTYNKTTGAATLTVLAKSGAGTYASWSVSIIPNGTGLASLDTNKFTGQQVFANLVSVDGAGLTSLTIDASNQYQITNSPAALTSIPIVQGVWAYVRVASDAAGTTITASSTLQVFGLSTGQSYKFAAGEFFKVIAISSTLTVVLLFRADGRAAMPWPAGYQSTATVASNAMTCTALPSVIDFRSATLASGALVPRLTTEAQSLTVPSGATLGTVSGRVAQLLLLAVDNGTAWEPAIVNPNSLSDWDEAGLISVTAISSGSDSANVVYGATARTNRPYRVISIITTTQATAGTWATAPTQVQPVFGKAVTEKTKFVSGELDFAGAGVELIVSHGLPVTPTYFTAQAICKTAEYGYAVGDVININDTDGDGARLIVLWVNATSIGFRCNGTGGAPFVYRRDSGAGVHITAANWKIQFRAEV